MTFTSRALAIFVATCLALNTMAQQCACTQQFDSGTSCLKFVEPAPNCEATTCLPYYVCESDGLSSCKVTASTANVIHAMQTNPLQCIPETVNTATVTALIRSSFRYFYGEADANQTIPPVVPAEKGALVGVDVYYVTTDTDCTVNWFLDNYEPAEMWTGPPDRLY
mmetsp:Transcript_24413/g.60901  ORF Transcript_24413/g.60901 Transcript_24413/m.60901 type:complete len:166 (-) Transcript_24413:15-512(-)